MVLRATGRDTPFTAETCPLSGFFPAKYLVLNADISENHYTIQSLFGCAVLSTRTEVIQLHQQLHQTEKGLIK